MTYKFLQNLLETAQGYRVCRIELWNVSPTWTGWQAEMPVIAGMQATATRHRPAERDRAGFRQLPKYLDDEIANLKEGLRLKYTAPKHNVQTVIGQMDALLKAPIAESPFVQMAKKDAPAFRKQLEDLEKTQVRPAIQRYRDFLRDVYVKEAREAIGVSANPDGGACYGASVKYYATVAMTPKEVHDLGLTQMDKIQTEMRQIGERGFNTSDPIALLKLVRTDPKYRFKSREELIKYAEAASSARKQALPKAFGRIPSAPVIVEPVSALSREDGSRRPGGSAVSRRQARQVPDQRVQSERSRARRASSPRLFTRRTPAITCRRRSRSSARSCIRFRAISSCRDSARVGRCIRNGWPTKWGSSPRTWTGSVCSRTKPFAPPGSSSIRACTCSGGPARQAIDYVLSHTTETPDRAAAEIDRYIAVPAQATAYMIGNLEIRKLRTRSRTGPGREVRRPGIPRSGARRRIAPALGVAGESRSLDQEQDKLNSGLDASVEQSRKVLMATAAVNAVTELIPSFSGRLLQPDDALFDEARRVHNGLVDKRPGVIARCLGAADVVDALGLAKKLGLEVAVRGGGHNVGGRGTIDGGLLIDLVAHERVVTSIRRREPRAPKAGRSGRNSIARRSCTASRRPAASSRRQASPGLTLGGGLGWLMAKYGMALDNLLSVELVLADGKVVRASSDEHPDLFWAVRGGGGNFGVATSLEFRLHPVGPMVMGGLVAHPVSAAKDLLSLYRDLTATASDDLMLFFALLTGPDGVTKLAAIVAGHIGPQDRADAELRPVKAFGKPAMDVIGPMPYSVLNSMLDASFPRGARNYWKSHFIDRLTDDAIDMLIDAFCELSVADGRGHARALPWRRGPRAGDPHRVRPAQERVQRGGPVAVDGRRRRCAVCVLGARELRRASAVHRPPTAI